MTRCSHCDVECNSTFDICKVCVETGHAVNGRCLVCREEAMETVARLSSVEIE